MRLSARGKYGLYAMYYLAVHQLEGPQSLQHIASMNIPRQYLEQLLGKLRRAGLVKTVRGARGGYMLAKPAHETTLLDIMNAMEGPVSFCECITNDSICEQSNGCGVRRVWGQITDGINRQFSGITLENMLLNNDESEITGNDE